MRGKMGKFKDFYESTLKKILLILLTLLMDATVIYCAFFVVNFQAAVLILLITVPILVAFNYLCYLVIRDFFRERKKGKE